MGKKEDILWIGIALILIVSVIYFIARENYFIKTITPSQAYEICDKENCSIKSIFIIGQLTGKYSSFGIFSLTDGNKTVYIDLRQSNATFLEVLEFYENSKLENEGVSEVRLKGKLKYDQNKINFIIELKETKFIGEYGCMINGEINSQNKSCFNLDDKKMKTSEAYKQLQKSKFCNENLFAPTGYFRYYNNINKWQFEMITQEGKCIAQCYTWDKKIAIESECISNRYIEEDV